MHIAPHHVHLWQSTVDGTQDELSEQFNLLATDEKARCLRFHFPMHRNRYIHAHATLRKILGLYLNCHATDIQFEKDTHGKPFITHPNTSLTFNLSHAENEVRYAIHATHPLGVDIERIKTSIEETLAARFFTQQEHQALMRCPKDERTNAFYFLWVAKEAVIKAAGRNLYTSLKQFSITLHKKNQSILFENMAWQLISRDASRHFKMALACHQAVNELAYYVYGEVPHLQKIEQLHIVDHKKTS